MAEDLPLAEELSAVFARMSGLLLSQETVASALRLVTSLAIETISGTFGSGVTLLDKQGHKVTAAASNASVERADSLQYELDEGPCLAAWAGRTRIRVDEIATDGRWPRWSRAVEPLGLRSSLSAALVTRDTAVGAIKVYATEPAAYDEHAEELLTLFAAQAAILVANMQTFDRAQRLSEDLKDALRTRDVIGQAKGILMSRDGIDEDAAFAMLVSVSMRENRKVRDIAQALVESTVRRRR